MIHKRDQTLLSDGVTKYWVKYTRCGKLVQDNEAIHRWPKVDCPECRALGYGSSAKKMTREQAAEHGLKVV